MDVRLCSLKEAIHADKQECFLTIFLPSFIPQIRMNVTEGLTCGFGQQAVVIDPELGRFVKLGNVHKTVVAFPDLDNAFAG